MWENQGASPDSPGGKGMCPPYSWTFLIPYYWGSWSSHSWREINSPPCRVLRLCLRTFPKLSEPKEFSQWLEGALHTQRWHLESPAADFLFPCDMRLIQFWIHSCPKQGYTWLPAQVFFKLFCWDCCFCHLGHIYCQTALSILITHLRGFFRLFL